MKIIEKEKARQEQVFELIEATSLDSRIKHIAVAKKDSHKQSLINLKEHFEEEANELWKIYNYYDTFGDLKNASIIFERMEKSKNAIKELNQMIEKYE